MSQKIRVLVVDDSAVVRQVVTQTLSRDPNIEVIGAALDPVFALEKMKTNWPDVIVLDLEMPRMDGLTFLRRIMAERPTPEATFARWKQHQPTVFFGAPTGFAGMLAHPALPARADVSLRMCSSAGEALPAEIAQRFPKGYRAVKPYLRLTPQPNK